MYGIIGTEIIKEIAENTIFSEAALDKRDAQKPAHPLEWLLSKFQRQESADSAVECDEAPRLTSRLVDGIARK